jgi:hypothetical protein
MNWADLEAKAVALLVAQDALERESADANAPDDPALKLLHRIHLHQHAERVRRFVEAVIRLRHESRRARDRGHRLHGCCGV